MELGQRTPATDCIVDWVLGLVQRTQAVGLRSGIVSGLGLWDSAWVCIFFLSPICLLSWYIFLMLRLLCFKHSYRIPQTFLPPGKKKQEIVNRGFSGESVDFELRQGKGEVQ